MKGYRSNLMSQETQNHHQSVLSFDGVDDFILFSQVFDRVTDKISLEFWANGANGLADQTGLLRAASSECNRIFSVHLPWTNHIYWDAGNQTGFDRIHKGTQEREYKDTWNHWAFVKDSTTGEMFIYRNGELWQSGTGHQRSLIRVETFTIGCFWDSYKHWAGLLSEFRIWNIALTPERIQQNMNTRLTGKEAGLAAYWPLNEGGGTVAKDKTGNGYDGTINGAVWQTTELPVKPQARQSLETSLGTGLQDYAYWYRWKQSLPQSSDSQSFRRGRIWS
ncbi:MAG: cyanobactin biosynthesis PatC/TenC/TruC family protein [Cyanobacteria bacterium J007]|nr:MAG: cyanobactin biosynthesis PatC/TenC/TruC family protein [Cyanobacteria bacterium J007]